MSNCVIDFSKQLISIPSISPMDLGCQKLIASRLIKLGFTVEYMNFNETHNLWAYKGNGMTLAFAGHTDVVPSGSENLWKCLPFSPTIFHDSLFGRGVADMKGALAAMVIAVENFIKKQPVYEGRLAFLITSDEESKAIDGTKRVIENLIKRKENIDYCIIGEPSSEEQLGDVIKNGRRGSLTANLKIYGVQGHIAYPHLIDNPIHKVLSFLTALISTQWDLGNIFFSPTSVQIYDLRSQSSSSNMTPNELSVKFNFRFNNELSTNKIKTRVEELLQSFNLNYTINWILSGHPFITQSNELINIVSESIQNLFGIVPKLSTSGGTSDGRFIKSIGAQILELGLLNKTIHRINENVKIKDLKKLCSLYEHIITKIFIK